MNEWQKSFGVRVDVRPQWDRMMSAKYSFVETGARGQMGSGVDLYVTAMMIGLRICNKLEKTPPMRGLDDYLQFRQVRDECDVEAIARHYGIYDQDFVKALGRYAGEGTQYIYTHHFDTEEEMLDLEGLLSTFALNENLKLCSMCEKLQGMETEVCSCGSQEFS
jgi:hypothetical protein